MRVAHYIAALALVLMFSWTHAEKSCTSGFDVYFILDRSTSVSKRNFQTETVQFVQDVLEHLTSPRLRTSIITFSSNAELMLQLTSDRSLTKEAVRKLATVEPGGNTHIELGLEKARLQVQAKGTRTASVVILLTDGELTREPQAVREALKLRRDFGATVIAVGVGQYKYSQLTKLANTPSSEYVFTVKNYQTLESITDKIINKACIGVSDIQPEKVCVSKESFDVTATGNGFTRTYDQSKIVCKFFFNTTYSIERKPIDVTDTKLKCLAPPLTDVGSYINLEILFNGKIFTSSIRITAVSCQKKETKPKESELLSDISSEPSSPTKKWPTVDASFYGGGGVGGVKPVRVKWGERGATESGNKLTKTPDAKIISNGDEDSPTGSSRSDDRSCLQQTKGAFSSFAVACYTKLASLRPDKGGRSKFYSSSDER